MRRTVPLAGALALLLSGSAWTFPTSALAAGGDLDPTFGDGGLVTSTEFFEGLAGGNRIAFQPDGKIVVAGYQYPGEEREVFAVARFDGEGLPDPTFSGDGIASTTFRSDVGCNEEARSVIVQADGRIVAVGVSSCPSPPGGADGTFAITRYDDDGTPDTTFGDNGTVMTGFGDPADCSAQAEGVALDPEGAIVVAGTMGCTKAGINSRFAVARYTTDGSLDASFSDDGRVTTNLTPQYEKVSDVAVQSDGKIVVSGTAAYWIVEIPDALPSRAALARYDVDGSLDTTFGRDGRVTISFRSRRCPGSSESYGLVVQPDGKIVEGGSAACAAEAGGLPHPRWALA
ncbi:MAG TPA: delta-60 repeat domain-containing protein, partial [Actinomycetota bacterium]|nr:delta-60 repeat domain-containing protein [Actinomycetota bacterium]